MSMGHTSVQAATAAMTARLQATGTKISEAVASYTEQDFRSAALLGKQVV
jgi:hypothetical protein